MNRHRGKRDGEDGLATYRGGYQNTNVDKLFLSNQKINMNDLHIGKNQIYIIINI
jgi:hypothetical protein